MLELLRVAQTFTTPVSIAALVCIIFWSLLRSLVAKNTFSVLDNNQTLHFLNRLLSLAFVLASVVVILVLVPTIAFPIGVSGSTVPGLVPAGNGLPPVNSPATIGPSPVPGDPPGSAPDLPEKCSALRLNGAGQYVIVNSSNQLHIGGSFTLEARVKLLRDQVHNAAHIMAKNLGTSNLESYAVYFDKGRQMLVGNSWSLPSTGVESTTPFILEDMKERWFHIAYIYDKQGQNFILYMNGVEAKRTPATYSISYDHSPLTIGLEYEGSHNEYYFLNGSIDEVRIWNTARTPMQIADNQGRRIGTKEKTLVAYYPFDDLSGDVARDHSENGNHGLLRGDASWEETPCLPKV